MAPLLIEAHATDAILEFSEKTSSLGSLVNKARGRAGTPTKSVFQNLLLQVTEAKGEARQAAGRLRGKAAGHLLLRSSLVEICRFAMIGGELSEPLDLLRRDPF